MRNSRKRNDKKENTLRFWLLAHNRFWLMLTRGGNNVTVSNLIRIDIVDMGTTYYNVLLNSYPSLAGRRVIWLFDLVIIWRNRLSDLDVISLIIERLNASAEVFLFVMGYYYSILERQARGTYGLNVSTLVPLIAPRDARIWDVDRSSMNVVLRERTTLISIMLDRYYKEI